MTQQYKSVLTHFAHFLPEKKVTNDDLSKVMETNDAWITERSGIKERRYVEGATSTSDLAIGAVESLLKKSGRTPDDFDYIIAATLSPDYYFPGIAPIIQHKLKFKCIPALDIRVQCSAFVYAVQMADALIKSGLYKRILLVFADAQSKLLDFTTNGRNVAVLFADGAGAAICESVPTPELPTRNNTQSGVLDTLVGADGSGVELLLTRAPGTAHKEFINQTRLENGEWHPYMDGKAVFKHAITRMCEVVDTLMQRNQLTVNDIACLIPHQANQRISDMVRDKMGLPPEKVFNNIHCYGNTTSATISICISEAIEQKKLKKGDLIITVAFGAGFTWGGNLIRL